MFILSGVSSYLWYLYCMYIVLQSKLLFPTIFVIYKISFFPTASDILRSKMVYIYLLCFSITIIVIVYVKCKVCKNYES